MILNLPKTLSIKLQTSAARIHATTGNIRHDNAQIYDIHQLKYTFCEEDMDQMDAVWSQSLWYYNNTILQHKVHEEIAKEHAEMHRVAVIKKGCPRHILDIRDSEHGDPFILTLFSFL